jgi:hypothetical protein
MNNMSMNIKSNIPLLEFYVLVQQERKSGEGRKRNGFERDRERG